MVLGLSALSAQKINIKGVVQSEEETLVSASVVLLSEKDSTLLSFGLTNNEGEFLIERVKTGKFLLQITYLGFEQYSETVEVVDSDIDMGEIVLSPAANQLDAIEIEGEHIPMMVKKDTLEYNADAFQTKPNEVVEDLLKRMPGIEVDSDGTITAQGEEVQQVLVEGKKFFGDDPKVATRNLPADAVQKVQVYDKKSDAAEFSGVDDGERQKTINLDLKEDSKVGAFGNVGIGYGTDDRYQGTMSLSRFSGKTQLSLIGNFNNINEQGFSSNDYFSFMRGVGWGRNTGGIGPSFGLSDGFVDTNAGGVNLNWDVSKKTELNFSYFLNNISNNISSLSNRENYVDEGDNFFTDESSVVENMNDNHRFHIEIEQEIDSTQNLRIRSSLSLSNASSFNMSNISITEADDVLINNTDSDITTDGKNNSFSVNGTYRKKFGQLKSRTLTLSGSYNDGLSEAVSDLVSDNVIYDEFGEVQIQNAIIQNQLNDDSSNDYRLELSYVEPVGNGSFVELKYRRQNYTNDVLSEFYDIVSGDRILNESLSNAFVRDYYYDRYSTSFHHNTDASQLTLEAAVQSSHLQGDVTYEDLVIKTDVFRFLPRISLRHELNNSQRLRVNYSTSISEPSLTQLQPNPDNSNPLNIYIGNPGLIPSYNHNLNLNFFSFDQFSSRNVYANLRLNYTKNDIINVTNFDENRVQTTSPENVPYSYGISGSQGFSSPFKPLKIRINLRNRISYNKSFVYINNNQSDLHRINGNVRLEIENRNKEVLDWRLGGSYGYNINQYSDTDKDNISYSNQNVFGNITYYYKKSMSVSSGITVDFYSQEQFSDQTTVPIWTASISKYFLKDNKGEFKISGFDLLNRNVGISRTEDQNYVQNSEIISLGRYFMASFIYKI